MASQVNKTFVVVLSTVLLCVCLGVGAAYYFLGSKSAADNIRQGDTAAAAGDWDKAIRFYGNAVNKEKTNTAYLEKWIDAMAKSTPSTQQQYQERLTREYVAAMMQLATVRRTDVKSHSAFLGAMLEDMRRAQRDAVSWNNYVTEIEKAMRLFPDSDTNREQLRRFRGVARSQMVMSRIELKPQDYAQMVEDLQVALKLDPKDSEAAVAMAQLKLNEMTDARRRSNDVVADQLLAETRKILTDFIALSPPAPEAQVLLSQVNMREAARVDAGKSKPMVLAMSQQAEGLLAIESVLKSDPKTVRSQTAIGAVYVYLATNPPEGFFEKVMSVFDHMIKGNPNSALLRAQKADTALDALNRPAEAEVFFGELEKMPNVPLSVEGLALFSLRNAAVARQADAALAQWNKAATDGNAADATKHLDRAKGYREAYAKKVGSAADPTLLMLDAKIADAVGDGTRVRQLLTEYNDRTDNNDQRGLFMLARVLYRQGNLGGAKQQLQRMNDIKRPSLESLRMLAQIEVQQQNYPAAIAIIEQLLADDPTNPEFQNQLSQIKLVSDGSKSADPWIRDFNRLETMLMQTAPDIDVAKALAADLVKRTDEPQRLNATVQRAIRLNDLATAKIGVDKILAKNPNDEATLRLKTMIESPDPLAIAIAEIEKSDLPELSKLIRIAIMQEQSGKREEAAATFDKAEKLAPDDPTVLAVRFENAIAGKRTEEAAKIAEKATAKNIDAFNGKTYQIRVLLLENKVQEAQRIAQELTEKDKLNPLPWRLLGEARLADRQFEGARNALTRSLQIKNNDPRAALLLARTQLSLGQNAEALRDARERNRVVGGDPEFSSLLLDMEFDFGDRDAAIVRRQRIFDGDPTNLVNTAKLAEWYIRLRKPEQAAAPIAKLRESKATAIQVLDAAQAILAGKKDEALKFADDFVEANKAGTKGAEGYLAFAFALRNLGFGDLTMEILERARAVQLPDRMEADRTIGDLQFSANEFEKAIAAYERVRAAIKDDDSQLLLKRIVECHTRLGQFDKAATLLAEAKPGGADVFQIHLLTAEVQAGLGDKVKARAALDAAVKAAPTQPVTLFKRAQFNITDEKYVRDAEQDLAECLRLNARFFPARRMLANSFARQGNTDKMLGLMEEGIKADSSNEEARVLLIRALQQLGRSERANALAFEAIEETKGDPRWYSVAADLFRSQRDFAREAGMLGKVWDQTKTMQVAGRYVDCLLRLTPPDVAKAEQILATPELKADESGPLLLSKARVAQAQGKTADAERLAASAMKFLNPAALEETTRFTDEVGAALGGTDAAIRFLAARTPAEGWTEQMRFQQARLAALQPQKRAEGIKKVEDFVATSTDAKTKLAALTFLAEISYSQKDYERSATFFKRCLEITPEDPKLLNNVAFLLSKYLDRASEALPLAEKAFAAAKDNPSYADTLGSAFFKLKQYDKAETAFLRSRGVAEDAISRTPATIHLAELRLVRGERTTAEALLREVRTWAVEDPRILEQHGDELKLIEDRVRAAP
ncbi:MAG: tetratricopeptide repeat protein [Phycisphaerales bacterium]|nr:tetratricopeptide repeat protein [Phycisphaerales bacterium]